MNKGEKFIKKSDGAEFIILEVKGDKVHFHENHFFTERVMNVSDFLKEYDPKKPKVTSYYEDQLNKVFTHTSEYPRTIKISHETVSTNWLGLDDESATLLVKHLMENYTIDKDVINETKL